MAKETEKDLEQTQNEEAVEETETSQNEEGGEMSELEAAKAEAAEYKDKYLRAHADFENAKKRLEKDKAWRYLTHLIMHSVLLRAQTKRMLPKYWKKCTKVSS